jgi:hypothetical protein
MQPRELRLAIAVVALVMLAIGKYALDTWLTGVGSRETRINALRKEVEDKSFKVTKGRLASAKLAAWQKRSLPTDRQLARAQYQAWLRGLVERAKLTNVDLNSQLTPGRRDQFEQLKFTVSGQGSLEQITQLLYEFYAANHLQRIRSLQIQPDDQSGKLKLGLVIDALILPGADRKDQLNSEPSQRLAGKDQAYYRQSVVARNIFGEYVPPAPPVVAKKEAPKPPSAPPGIDTAKFAVVTAILQVNQRPQIWVSVRTTGQTLRLFEGDPFHVGTLEGTVTRIDQQQVELAAGGKRLLVNLGEALRDGQELPAGEL